MKYLLIVLICICCSVPEINPVPSSIEVASLQGEWELETLTMVNGTDTVTAPLDTLLKIFPDRVDLYAIPYMENFKVKGTEMVCESTIYGIQTMVIIQGKESVEIYSDLRNRPAIKIDLLQNGKLRVRSVVNEWSMKKHCVIKIAPK